MATPTPSTGVSYIGLGRRKTSVAKARLVAGTGKITINGKAPSEVFPNPLVVQDMEQPLTITETRHSFDVASIVNGGGFTGQAGAVRLAITRALINANPEFKKTLKASGMVTRDSRSKERKKFGKYGARRSPQFTKR